MFVNLPLNQTNTDIRELTDGFIKKLKEKIGSEGFQVNVLGTSKNTRISANCPDTHGGVWGARPRQTPIYEDRALTRVSYKHIRTTIVEQTDEGRDQ
jgi:hypothetical protein